jgi:hypothetical protein
LLPGSVAIPFTDRARLLVSRGIYGATQNVRCGLNGFDMNFLVHCLRPDDLSSSMSAQMSVHTPWH